MSRIDLDNNRSEAHDTIRVRDALEIDEESLIKEMNDDEELMKDLRIEDVMNEKN